ncbi:WD40/YVTN/BNR-like repeat-containing protein [Streptomyces sp. NPDC057486]|uniref:WD40/YVTN/BNR-like repeat-containing protein n=1 Tax=Streptomyces sp. NPDC057486 TaxID=3346145 RepID=UPI003678BB7B
MSNRDPRAAPPATACTGRTTAARRSPCDPHRPGLLYVGEWTTGLYRSEDAGESWVRADAGLPFARSRLSVLSHVLADPLHDGRLYAGFVREGLRRSDDRGESWTRVPGEDATRNATSVAVAGDRIVVVSEPMRWTGTPSLVWCSEDDGHSWQDVHPAEQGAVRWKGVLPDAEGRIHAGTGGNGIFTARLAGGQGRAGAAGSDTTVPVRRASSAANTTR